MLPLHKFHLFQKQANEAKTEKKIDSLIADIRAVLESCREFQREYVALDKAQKELLKELPR